MTLTIDDVLAALRSLGREIVETGTDQWKAQCPSHPDETPSLSVWIDDGGNAALNCHAGCKWSAVIDALGLNDKPDGRKTSGRTKKKKDDKPPYVGPLWPPPDANFSHYLYQSADNGPLGAVVVERKDNGKKDVKQWLHVKGKDYTCESMPDPRPLYRLQHLKPDAEVTVVEGEKCADRVAETWPGFTVVTWPGGTKAWHKVDWRPLAGRTVTLVADADQPGRACMQLIAARLETLSCTVYTVLPDGSDGNDIADWIAEGPDAVAERMKLRQPFVAPADDLPDPNTLRENNHYRLLGLIGDRVGVRISAGRILTPSREALCSPNTLVSLAPQRFWHMAAQTESLSPMSARTLGDSLIREADRLGPVDTTRIFGRGAIRLSDGTVVWHLGDRLYKQQDEHPLDDPTGIWLAEPAIKLTASAPQTAVSELREAVMQYRWFSDDDGRRFLGWIVAALTGGALEWRPHLYMVAPAGAGKSWLLREVLETLLGPCLIPIADGTAAAIARLTDKSSLPIKIDEAEPKRNIGKRVQESLDLLRIASGGEGLRLRADPTGGVSSQAPRFAALLSATSIPWMDAADSSRITLVRLGAEVEDWPAVSTAILGAMKNAEALRSRMIRDGQAISDGARSITTDLQQTGGTMSSRDALTAGALTAGWRWWNPDDRTIVKGYANRPEADDAVDALLTILQFRIRDPGEPDIPVAEALRLGRITNVITALYGIRYEQGDLLIAPNHPGLKEQAARTQLATTDLRRLLIQLPGAVTSQHHRRFGAFRDRAIIVREHALEEMGIDLKLEQTEADL